MKQNSTGRGLIGAGELGVRCEELSCSGVGWFSYMQKAGPCACGSPRSHASAPCELRHRQAWDVPGLFLERSLGIRHLQSLWDLAPAVHYVAMLCSAPKEWQCEHFARPTAAALSSHEAGAPVISSSDPACPASQAGD